MEEKMTTMQEKDELAMLIVQRLGERQRKIQRMQELEHSNRKGRFYVLVVTLAAAACVTLLLVFSPWKTSSVLDELDIQKPSTELYRSAAPDLAEISQLMEKPDYDAALAATAKALKHSEIEIEDFSDVYDTDDEEMIYEEEQERVLNSELRWTYIYLLVNAERYKEATKELKVYLKRKKYCEHKDEAIRLLNEIKKK